MKRQVFLVLLFFGSCIYAIGQTHYDTTHIDPAIPTINDEVFLHYHYVKGSSSDFIENIELIFTEGGYFIRMNVDFESGGAGLTEVTYHDSLINLGYLPSGFYTAIIGERFYGPEYHYRDTIEWHVLGPSNINEQENSNLSVSPNPFIDAFHIESQEPIESIIIRDLEGKLVSSESINSISHNYSGHSLSTGVFIMELRTAKGTAYRRLVKQ